MSKLDMANLEWTKKCVEDRVLNALLDLLYTVTNKKDRAEIKKHIKARLKAKGM